MNEIELSEEEALDEKALEMSADIMGLISEQYLHEDLRAVCIAMSFALLRLVRVTFDPILVHQMSIDLALTSFEMAREMREEEEEEAADDEG
jgi:hypothetical protein